MPTTSFRAITNGFHFSNSFTNHLILGVTTNGLCGGMSFAALDYFFNGLHIPPHTTADFPLSGGVPDENSRFYKYLFSRQIDSFGSTTALQFLSWGAASDAAVESDTRTKEIPKLKAEIDQGRPVVLGLVTRGGAFSFTSSHQVVAYGYDVAPTGIVTVDIYDSNHPDIEVQLIVNPGSSPVNETSTSKEKWKGFFVQSYSKKLPDFMASSEEVWSDDWSPDWTTFMPFDLRARRHYLAYKETKGRAAIDRIKADGHGVESFFDVPDGTWTKGWTSFMPFNLGGQPHYLAYKVNTGDVAFDRILPGGVGTATIFQDKWTKGWTSFVPFELGGQPHYLAYKTNTGQVSIDRIRPNGQGTDTIFGAAAGTPDAWTKGWTTFMPFTSNGHPHYLAYKIGTGQMSIDRIRPDASGVDTVFTDKYTKGWTSFVPFDFNAKPHYFCYKADSGQFSVDRFKANLQGVDVVRKGAAGSWPKDWTSFVPFNLNGRPHYLGYKKKTGQMTFSKIIP